MKWKRILVATDFSAPAGRALESARALAAETGGTIVLLHVVSPPMSLYPQEMADLATLTEAWMRDARRDLLRLATRARSGGLRMRVETAAAPVLAIPWTAAEKAMRVLSRGSRARTKRLRPAPSVERPRPAGRRTRGPWSGQAHTGRGGPAGRRGGSP